MALQVWLPLNGNLENRGLSNTTVAVSGAAVDNSGKIGSCYKFDGSDDYISINSSILYSAFKGQAQPFSIAMWCYHMDTTRAILFGDYQLSGGIGFNIELKTNHIFRFYWNNNPDYSSTVDVGLNTWTHVAVTYDGSSLCFYKNGVIENTVSITLAALNKTSGSFYLGRDSRTGTTALNGKLNDVRIYDHCLSRQEVKDLARGLIVHYPLCTRESILSKYSSVNWNQLIPNGDFSNGTSNWSIHDSSIEIISVSNGELTLQKVGGSYGGMCRVNPFTVDSTHVYYLKATLKSNDGTQAFFGFCTSSWTVGSNIQYNTTSLNYETISFTASPAANSAYLILRIGAGSSSAGVSLTCKNFMCIDLTAMFGAGNEPTKEECDLIFVDNYYTYDTGTTKSLVSPIYDESGYKRNATMTSSYFSLSDDTRRYDYSTVCNGSSCMQIVSPTTGARSASLWLKFPTSVQNTFVAFVDNKSRLGFGRGTTGFICSTVSNTKTFPVTALNAGSWHHIVVVNEGTSPSNATRKLYIDGVEQTPTTTDNYWGMNGQDILQVGARAYNISNYPGLNGLMSDFRLYAAALTAEDVLDLYENSATVDNFGSLHCYETKETADNLLTFENLQEDASGTISITTANGEKAIAVPGNAFIGSSHRFFEGRFQPNTQYKFDLWLDSYGAIGWMGICVYYTDNTNSGKALVDTAVTTQGYKHKIYYSDPSKSISRLGPYTSDAHSTYYRTDSIIIPMDNPTNVENKGIVDTGYFREDTTEVSIGKGDNFDVNNLIEK